jgi:hypothetical protein
MTTHDNDNTKPWTSAERALLDGLLDVILPATGDAGPKRNLPAGSTLSVADFLATRIVDTAGLGELLRDGLRAAAALVGKRGAANFGALSTDDRVALAGQLEKNEPVIFRALVRHAYMGYYTHPSIPPQHGLPNRPPQPLGHEVPRDEAATLDALLAPVRARGRHYRDAG